MGEIYEHNQLDEDEEKAANHANYHPGCLGGVYVVIRAWGGKAYTYHANCYARCLGVWLILMYTAGFKIVLRDYLRGVVKVGTRIAVGRRL